MALFNLNGDEITDIPHKKDYEHWMKNLSRDDYNNVIGAIHAALDDAKNSGRPLYSAHLPGKDWTNTPYDPIYIACHQDQQAAKLFYGQLCWEAVTSHEADWTFINEEREDAPGGKIYFPKR